MARADSSMGSIAPAGSVVAAGDEAAQWGRITTAPGADIIRFWGFNVECFALLIGGGGGLTTSEDDSRSPQMNIVELSLV